MGKAKTKKERTMRYRFLLFDLDDTLLDFQANEAVSLAMLFSRHGLDLTEDRLREYHRVNQGLWSDYEKGLIPLERVLSNRFSDTLRVLGMEIDGMAWENEYRELLGNGSQTVEGAFEVCRKLALSHRLFVVTNGIGKTQRKRLHQSGLDVFFEKVFDSQSIGFQKPTEEFFEYVARHIPGFDKKQALVVGDSLNTDIKGGFKAGLDTCWLNRKGQKNATDFQSTFMAADLSEVYEICML